MKQMRTRIFPKPPSSVQGEVQKLRAIWSFCADVQKTKNW